MLRGYWVSVWCVDGRNQELSVCLSVCLGWGKGAYVGRNSVAHGMDRMLSMGALVVGSQPRASVQGTRTLSILTLPDSVRRRPMLSQLWEKIIAGCWVGARAKMCLSVFS